MNFADSSSDMTSDALPEAQSSKTGASVGFEFDPQKKWFVFRASYGRVEKALDILVEDGTYAYYAQHYVQQMVRGRRKKVLKALIPNLLFAYTTEEKAEQYIKATPALSFLSYYYNHFERDSQYKNPPLTVSNDEMLNFIRTTITRSEHLMFVKPSQCHYKSGERVRVVEGLFQGVEGRVARVAGQQRVIVSLSKVGLISTAYIPTAFIEKCNTDTSTSTENLENL